MSTVVASRALHTCRQQSPAAPKGLIVFVIDNTLSDCFNIWHVDLDMGETPAGKQDEPVLITLHGGGGQVFFKLLPMITYFVIIMHYLRKIKNIGCLLMDVFFLMGFLLSHTPSPFIYLLFALQINAGNSSPFSLFVIRINTYDWSGCASIQSF